MYEGLLKHYKEYLPVTEKNTANLISRRKHTADSIE